MKTEHLILLGIGAYFLYFRSQSGSGLTTYPPGGASRSTGSGGTTASGAGMGTSVNNPPVGGLPGNNAWSGNPTYNPQPGDPGFVGPVDMNPQPGDPNFVGPVDTGAYYAQCMDGSYAMDASQCPENQIPYDSGDPCDTNSAAYDWSQCGSAGYL